eukprot:gene16944-23219_t
MALLMWLGDAASAQAKEELEKQGLNLNPGSGPAGPPETAHTWDGSGATLKDCMDLSMDQRAAMVVVPDLPISGPAAILKAAVAVLQPAAVRFVAVPATFGSLAASWSDALADLGLSNFPLPEC